MLFRKKRHELTAKQKRWNELWELYSTGELDAVDRKIYYLCDYDGGVNGEGHSGYFSNNESELAEVVATLCEILPENHRQNLVRAYKSYDTDAEETVCDEADDFFYENEENLLDILRKFADGLEI